MSQRYFDLAEAQGHIPRLAEIFAALVPLRDDVGRLTAERNKMQAGLTSNGGSDLGRRLSSVQGKLDEANELIGRYLKEVEDMGAVVKGVGPGLVDFPSRRDGREVYLCWREGEDSIEFWHEIDTGFGGRQPL